MEKDSNVANSVIDNIFDFLRSLNNGMIKLQTKLTRFKFISSSSMKESNKTLHSPKVTVLMSVYNGQKYLSEAVDSILNQTFANFEFLIIDDGSTDNSIKIINSYRDSRIVFIKQDNRGLPSALNIGLKNSKGKYIARMDADDICFPERLEVQYAFLEACEDCVVVGSNAEVIDVHGMHLFTSDQDISWETIREKLPITPFFHSSTMFRKEEIIRCGGYNEKLLTAQDCLLFNQMAKYGELWNIKKPLIKYRIVPNAVSMMKSKDSKIIIKIIEKILENGELSNKDYIILKTIYNNKKKYYKYSNYYLKIGKIFIEHNFNRRYALKNLLLSVKNYPFSITAWFNLLLTFMPKFRIRKWKQSRGVEIN